MTKAEQKGKKKLEDGRSQLSPFSSLLANLVLFFSSSFSSSFRLSVSAFLPTD